VGCVRAVTGGIFSPSALDIRVVHAHNSCLAFDSVQSPGLSVSAGVILTVTYLSIVQTVSPGLILSVTHHMDQPYTETQSIVRGHSPL
jgi:hypothetical protein